MKMDEFQEDLGGKKKKRAVGDGWCLVFFLNPPCKERLLTFQFPLHQKRRNCSQPVATNLNHKVLYTAEMKPLGLTSPKSLGPVIAYKPNGHCSRGVWLQGSGLALVPRVSPKVQKSTRCLPLPKQGQDHDKIKPSALRLSSQT